MKLQLHKVISTMDWQVLYVPVGVGMLINFFLMKGNVCGFAGVWENQNAQCARLKGGNPRARPRGEGQREEEGLHLNLSSTW